MGWKGAKARSETLIYYQLQQKAKLKKRKIRIYSPMPTTPNPCTPQLYWFKQRFHFAKKLLKIVFILGIFNS